MVIKLFVYGTLKPGEAYFETYCSPTLLAMTMAWVQGCLYHLPAGYPALTKGDRWVAGSLLTFADDQIIATIDDFEDYDPQRPAAANLYHREQVAVFGGDRQPLGMAWGYVMTRKRVEQLGGVFIPEGEWSRHLWPSIVPTVASAQSDSEAPG